LSAALLLGRYLRSVIIFDVMKHRRHTIHGYLGFEKSTIKKAVQKSWSDVLQYKTVKRVNEIVEKVDKDTHNNLFLITTASNEKEKVNDNNSSSSKKGVFKSKYLIIATGVEHLKPNVRNFEKFIGNGIWHCPHCDGFETTGKKLIIIASNNSESEAIDYAKLFLGWTKDITLFLQTSTDLKSKEKVNEISSKLTNKQHNEVNLLDIKVIENDDVLKIIENANTIKGILTKGNIFYDADVIFYHVGTVINNKIAVSIGCELDEGYIKVNEKQQTSVPNVYAVGDVDTDRHYAVFASASGALAAVTIYEELLKSSLSVIKSNGAL